MNQVVVYGIFLSVFELIAPLFLFKLSGNVQNLRAVENSGYFLLLLKVTSRFARWGRFLFLPVVGYSHIPLRNSSISLVAGFLFTTGLINPVQASIQHPVELSSDSEIATAGFFHLQWQSAKYHGNWHLQESSDTDLNNFKDIYSGPDLARVISGKSDGIFYYRVITDTTPSPQMSNIVKVTVAHHPLSNAFLFFGVGALIFMAILVSILQGNRNNIQS